MSRGLLPYLLIMVGLCLGVFARAAEFGQLDESFAPALGTIPGRLSGLAGTSDGKYFVYGTFHRVGDVRRIYLARMKADDTLDPLFDARLSPTSIIRAITVQADGRILVLGRLHLEDGTVLLELVRFNGDGTVDESFRPPENLGFIYNCSLTTGSENIILNGLLLPTNNVASTVMLRLKSDGSIDPTFQSAVRRGPSIQIQPVAENKLLLVGSFSLSDVTEAWETNSTFLAPRPRPPYLPPVEPPPRSPSPLRLNADGSVDGAFSKTAIPEFDSLYPSPEGVIYSASTYSLYSDGDENAIQRFLANGEKDTSFTPWIESNVFVESLMPLADGKLLVQLLKYNEGATNTYSLRRLAADGSVEIEYEPVLKSFNIRSAGALELPDGSILTIASGGQPDSYKCLLKIHPDGEIEPAVGPTFTAIEGRREIVPTREGKFYLIGSTPAADPNVTQIGRWLNDGSKDGSFHASIGETNSIDSIKLLTNGDLMVLATQPVSYDRTLVRLNATGTVLRELAEGGSGFYFNLGSWDVFPDGRVVVGYSGSSFEPSPLLKMFTAELEEDPSFNSVLQEDRYTLRVTTTPHGKILVQSVTIHPDYSETFEQRFLTDGSLDNAYKSLTNETFLGIGGFDVKNRMYVARPAGGGPRSGGGVRGFRQVTGNELTPAPTTPCIQRILEDGTADPCFNVTLPARSTVYQLWIQRDGRILAAGVFYNADETKITTLIRLLPDGSIDETFALPAGEVVPISVIAVEADGNVLIGGAFDQIGGQPRAGLARLKSVEQAQVKNLTITSNNVILQLGGNVGRTWLIQTSPDLQTWTTVSAITTGIDTETVELAPPDGGRKFYRAVLSP